MEQQSEQWYGANSRTRVSIMTYDDANRLETEEIAESSAQTVTTVYGYDAGNNRTSKHVVASGTGSVNVELGHWTYIYNDANQLTRTDKREAAGGAVIGGASYLYDKLGNRASRIADGPTPGTCRGVWPQ